MGLDMYLKANKDYLKKEWYPEADQKIAKEISKVIPEIYESGNLNTITVGFEVGYWRKANQIHKWFIDNVQDGVDECRETYVSRDDLKKLLDLCKKVKEASVLVKGTVKNGQQSNKETNFQMVDNYQDGEVIVDSNIAEKLLPTQSGFFFGGTGYDEYYMHDIDNTIKICEKALKLPKGWSFSYRSSW